MEMNIHSILPEEIAAMGGHSNRVLNEKTGCIGYLTANLNASAPVFESSWHDRTPRLNTPEFTDDFNDMMDTLRQGILKSPAELRVYCAAHPDSLLQDNPSADTRYGFRINTGKYSYWMVCSFLSTDCRLWVNAFSFLSLDRYMREARNGPVDKSAIGYSMELRPMALRVLRRLTPGCFRVVRSFTIRFRFNAVAERRQCS